jgi:hypothetical protein
MIPAQIEARVLDIIEHVKSRQPIEDFHVELKSKWPEPQEAARLIAGHANAARGEPILWLIGINEELGVTGADRKEMANWLPAVQKEFDGIAPSPIDLNIPIDGAVIVALFIETNRAPYVVKNPAFGSQRGVNISFEVPWREGTRTRSARRSDLLQLLVPTVSLPNIEVLSAEMMISVVRDESWYWYFKIETYITPQIGYPCVLPNHQCVTYFEIVDLIEKTRFDNSILTAPYVPTYGFSTGVSDRKVDSLTINHTKTEAIIDGPGLLIISGETRSEAMSISLDRSNAMITVVIRPSHATHPITLSETLNWKSTDQSRLGFWELKK